MILVDIQLVGDDQQIKLVAGARNQYKPKENQQLGSPLGGPFAVQWPHRAVPPKAAEYLTLSHVTGRYVQHRRNTKQRDVLISFRTTTRLKEDFAKLNEVMQRLEALDAQCPKAMDQQISLNDPGEGPGFASP